MRYNLEEIKLRKVEQGDFAGQLFIQATVVNPDDDWEEPGTMTNFNERMVKMFAKYLAPAEPDGKDRFGRQKYAASKLLDASNPIPEKYLTLTNANWRRYVFPGGPRAAKDPATGQLRRNKAGDPIIATSVRVLTKMVRDNETGEFVEAVGWELEAQGAQMMNRLYKSLADAGLDASAGGVELPVAEAPLINGATTAAPAQAPAAAQPAPAAPAAPAPAV